MGRLRRLRGQMRTSRGGRLRRRRFGGTTNIAMRRRYCGLNRFRSRRRETFGLKSFRHLEIKSRRCGHEGGKQDESNQIEITGDEFHRFQ